QFYTLMLYAFAAGIEMDINKIEAFSSVLWEFDLPEIHETILSTAISLFKISFLTTHIRN
ncbi:MAG: hypothetical protein Q7J86_14130, partial [Bacteroidota bacterium]|nr:hypothetical protein [Bacteroidota bacterium]